MNRSCLDQNRHGVPGYPPGSGFSLIEVLIAVMVLAVGLLGLASIFPAVITQQRQAADKVMGSVASSVVRDQIATNTDIAYELLSQDGYADVDEPDADEDRVPNEQTDTDSSIINSTGEPVFGQHTRFLLGFSPRDEIEFNYRTGFSYLWEADWEWGSNNSRLDLGPRTVPVSNGSFNRDLYAASGGLRYRDPGERVLSGVPNDVPDLSVAARLYPGPYTAPGQVSDGPQFVWDFVPRRLPSGGVQMAVFVRRIDTGIRVADGKTLSEVLVSEIPGSPDHRYPVGRDENTGVPTLDGTGEYSVPLSARAVPVPSADYPYSPEYRENPSDPIPVLLDAVRLNPSISNDEELETARAAEVHFLAQVGQRFVDNFGVIRRVTEVLRINGDEVDLRVEPSYTLSQLDPAFGSMQLTGSDAQREAARVGKLRQIVFTPQVPVDVFVMEFSQQ